MQIKGVFTAPREPHTTQTITETLSGRGRTPAERSRPDVMLQPDGRTGGRDRTGQPSPLRLQGHREVGTPAYANAQI
ncbi:hypothetical protein EYF80_035576 [Liparis tanakae]|uniref:Uncharacterized protein n=1 Tax=Liparis tanakae TaxID=230148 RepID=A0A4Z2GN92_9TELE|nr:hypothetical protein EYF80_035576 [Liparis tanakae]